MIQEIAQKTGGGDNPDPQAMLASIRDVRERYKTELQQNAYLTELLQMQ